ncbi:MAG: hypothetical protein GY805_23900 [Chloroflexi bacterium]|nr:hypothetical protein [Chloroflexota bacterium]
MHVVSRVVVVGKRPFCNHCLVAGETAVSHQQKLLCEVWVKWPPVSTRAGCLNCEEERPFHKNLFTAILT